VFALKRNAESNSSLQKWAYDLPLNSIEKKKPVV
jgi:hypothetical protein